MKPNSLKTKAEALAVKRPSTNISSNKQSQVPKTSVKKNNLKLDKTKTDAEVSNNIAVILEPSRLKSKSFKSEKRKGLQSD